MSKFLDTNGLQYLWQKIKDAMHQCLITDTASGAIASFPDGAAMPMESLTVDLEPIQDLHGQDAPYPAGGGKNLLDPSLLVTQVSWKVLEVPLAPGTYTMSTNVTAEESSELAMYFRKNASDTQGSTTLVTSTHPVTRVIEEGDVPVLSFRRVSGTKVFTDYEWQIEEGSTATSYAPYENICPITGRESVTVVRTGINVFNKSEVIDGAYINDVDGSERQSADSKATGWISVVPGEKYYILTEQTQGAWGAWYDRNKTFIGGIIGYLISGNRKEQTAPSNAAYMRLTCYRSGSGNVDTFAVNYPSTDHDYHAYDGQSATIQLGQTVYGGTVDVTTGVMTVDRAYITLNGGFGVQNGVFAITLTGSGIKTSISTSSENIVISDRFKSNGVKYRDNVGDGNIVKVVRSNNQIACYSSAYASVDEFNAALAANPMQICYKLATPQTIQLTPAQLTTLLGLNNVWSDADSVTVEYVADPKLYIARLTEPDADMVADANITSGSYFMVGNTLYLATANIASGANIVPGVNCTKTNLSSALNAINS